MLQSWERPYHVKRRRCRAVTLLQSTPTQTASHVPSLGLGGESGPLGGMEVLGQMSEGSTQRHSKFLPDVRVIRVDVAGLQSRSVLRHDTKQIGPADLLGHLGLQP